jgi:hypothetical protein
MLPLSCLSCWVMPTSIRIATIQHNSTVTLDTKFNGHPSRPSAIGHPSRPAKYISDTAKFISVNLSVCSFVCFSKAYGGGRRRRDSRHKDNMISRLVIRQAVSRVTLWKTKMTPTTQTATTLKATLTPITAVTILMAISSGDPSIGKAKVIHRF